MDSISLNTPEPVDFNKLSDADKRELQQFIVNETALATQRKAIHSLTETCFKKCVGKISGPKLEKGEDSCVANCVERFMDGTNLVLGRLREMRDDGAV